jgi:23S rRNA U2552 (ribose-2'-O)-methylase RlmE/FtsJ
MMLKINRRSVQFAVLLLPKKNILIIKCVHGATHNMSLIQMNLNFRRVI